MTGFEDTHDVRPTNHTPTIALGVAALLLLIVGAMSYRDYVKKSVRKEVLQEQQLAQMGYPPNSQGYVQQQQNGGNPGFYQGPQQGGNQQQPYYNNNNNQQRQHLPYQQAPVQGQPQQQQQQPVQQAVQAQQQPQYDPSRVPSESNLPTPVDSEIDALQENLNKVKAQAQATEKRFNKIPDSFDSPATGDASQITAELPDFLKNSLEDPPGGNPEIKAAVERMKKQVASSPSLGRVLSYDTDWGFVTFSAGANQGVKVDQRFAVRRGTDVLGWVKVTEVHERQAIAKMVTKNAKDDLSVKPEPGDDLIQFEL